MKNTLLILLNLIFVFNIYAHNEIDAEGGFVALDPNGSYDQDGWALGIHYNGSLQNFHFWGSATNYVANGGTGYLHLDNNNSNDVTTVYLGNNITNTDFYSGPIIETSTSFTGDLYIKTRDNVRLQTDHNSGVVINAQNARNVFINGGTYDSTRRNNNSGQYAVNLSGVDNLIDISNATFLGPDVDHNWIVAPGGSGLIINFCPQIVLNNVICSGGNSRSITSFSGNGTINLDGGDGLILTSHGGQVTINGGEFSGGQAGDFSYDNNVNTNSYQVSANNGYSVRITCADLLISSNPVFSGPMYISAASFTISSNSNAQIEHLISNSQITMDSYTKNKISYFSGEGTLIISDTGEQFNKYDYDADQDGLSDSFEINISNTDPNNSDSDGDGLSDGAEINTYNTDPNNSDSDGDGLTDEYEVNTSSTDPNNADSDDDGLNDGDEVTNGTSPLITNIKPISNINYFYECQNGQNIEINAIPTDGYPTNFTYQWIQNDITIPSLFGGTGSSYTIGGSQEYNGNWSVLVSNDTGTTTNTFIFQVFTDLDQDGLSDGRETYVTFTNPNNPDTDNDSISDADEINIHSTDPNDLDTDDDGFDDGTELIRGLSPTSADTWIVNYILSNRSSFNSISNGMTLNQIKNLREGSEIFAVSNGNATIRMYVDESSDLMSNWSNTQHVLEMDMPANEDTMYYRFRMK